MAESSDLIRFKEAIALATSTSPFGNSNIKSILISPPAPSSGPSTNPSTGNGNGGSGVALPGWFVITNSTDASSSNLVRIDGNLIVTANLGAKDIIGLTGTFDYLNGATGTFNHINGRTGTFDYLYTSKLTTPNISAVSVAGEEIIGRTGTFDYLSGTTGSIDYLSGRTGAFDYLKTNNGIQTSYINITPSISQQDPDTPNNGTIWVKQGADASGTTTYVLMLDNNVIGSSTQGSINIRPQDWAQYTAISNVNMGGNNITNGANINISGDLRSGGTGTFDKLYTTNGIHTPSINAFGTSDIRFNNNIQLNNNCIKGATAIESANIKVTNIDTVSDNTNARINIKKSVQFEGDSTITGNRIISGITQDRTNYKVSLVNSSNNTVSDITTGSAYYAAGVTAIIQNYAGISAITTTPYSLALSNNTILSNSDIIPNTNSYFKDAGLNLGNENAWWNRAYIRDLHISPYTIRVIGDNGQQMAISYDVTTGGSTITTSDFTVQGVTTSAAFPGQIDASLLPFTGLTFASKINIAQYIAATGNNSLLDQMYSLIYTMNYSVVTAPYPRPLYITNYPIVQLINNIAGAYYVVDNTPENITVKLPKIRATTFLNVPDKTSGDTLRSTFTVISEDFAQIANGDILILVTNFQPNIADPTKFDIIFGWQEVNFQVPINGVSNQNIIDNSITTNKIADLSITNPKLAANAVSTSKIQDFSITSTKILNNAVTTSKIADFSIVSSKIVDGAVTTNKFADGVITTNKIADSAIISQKVADNAITTSKILDQNVTNSKLADGVITTSKIADGVITTNKIADSAIISQKIANDAITTSKILDQNVTNSKLADGVITTSKIADGVITTNKLDNNTISTSKLQSNSVTLDKISQDVINYINSTVTSGPTGAQGLAGPQGAQGSRGIDGVTGPRGIDGIIGLNGATGPTGPRGTDGIIGLNGATGPTGPRGTDGIIGRDGVTGATGPQGPPGENSSGAISATGTSFSNYLYWDGSTWVVGGINGKVSLGDNSGNGQGDFSVALGSYSGFIEQKSFAVGIGASAGNNRQGVNSVAIGKWAGGYYQGATGGNSIAIGTEAGWLNQLESSIAIGNNAGWQNQAGSSIAIGHLAGNTNQETYSIAIGREAGRNLQTSGSIAVGWQAGQDNQGSGNVAIGVAAGKIGQKNRGVAIGRAAGNDNQGMYSIAIGNSAGHTRQPDRSICLNASEYMINPEQTGACYIFPVRQDDTIDTNVVSYNTETSELVYRPIDALPVQVFNVSNSLTYAPTPIIYDKVSILSTRWDFNQNYIIDITVPSGYSGPISIKLAKVNKNNTVGNEILIGFITPGTTQSITLSYMQFEYGVGANKILDGDDIALYSFTNNTKNTIASNTWRMIKKQSNNIGNGTNTLTINSINWTSGEVNFTVTEEFSVNNNKFLTLYNVTKGAEYQRKPIKIKSVNRITGQVIYDSSDILNVNILKNNEYDGTTFITSIGTDFSIIVPSIRVDNAQIGDSLVFVLASNINNEVSNIMIMEETSAYLSNAYSIFATAHINDFPVNQGLIIPAGTYTYTFGATMTTGGLYGDIYDFRTSNLPFTDPNFYINLNNAPSISKQYTKVKPIIIKNYNRESGILTYDSIENFSGLFLKNGTSLDIYFNTNIGNDLTVHIPNYVIGDRIIIANLDLGVVVASNEYTVFPIVTDNSIYPIKITNVNRLTGEITYNATQNMTIRFVRNNIFDGTPFRSGIGVGLVYNAFNISSIWSQDGQDIWFSSSTTDISLKASNTVTLFNNSALNLFLGNNSIKYDINNKDNPTLTLIKGFTYHFIVNSPGNPLWIKNFQQTGVASSYNDGVTNNGISYGTIIFRVPYDAPNTLYYISQNSSLFGGIINIIDINNLGSGSGSSTTDINQQLLNVLESKVQVIETYIDILMNTYAIKDSNNNTLSLADIRNQIISGGNYNVLELLEKKIDVIEAYLNIFTQTYVVKDSNNNIISLTQLEQLLI